MARLLLVVEDTFAIRDRGLILIPGIAPQGDEVFRIGYPLRIGRPDGSELLTAIGGLDMIGGLSHREAVPILLLGLGRVDVPVGSKVWSVDWA